GMAYGVFNGLYGFALLAGAAAMGALYGVSVGWLVAFVAAIELLAAVAFLPLVRSLGARAAS
ncbi:MAG: MFS transporter, partial [Solirubrobacterales bacterium]